MVVPDGAEAGLKKGDRVKLNLAPYAASKKQPISTSCFLEWRLPKITIRNNKKKARPWPEPPTTHYLYDLNNQLIAETLADGTILREYIYLDGEPLVLKEYQTNPGTYYLSS